MVGLLQSLAAESNEFAIESIVELALTGYALRRTLGTTTPDVMLLEMTELDRVSHRLRRFTRNSECSDCGSGITRSPVVTQPQL
jgi:hypothetical protein